MQIYFCLFLYVSIECAHFKKNHLIKVYIHDPTICTYMNLTQKTIFINKKIYWSYPPVQCHNELQSDQMNIFKNSQKMSKIAKKSKKHENVLKCTKIPIICLKQPQNYPYLFPKIAKIWLYIKQPHLGILKTILDSTNNLSLGFSS